MVVTQQFICIHRICTFLVKIRIILLSATKKKSQKINHFFPMLNSSFSSLLVFCVLLVSCWTRSFRIKFYEEFAVFNLLFCNLFSFIYFLFFQKLHYFFRVGVTSVSKNCNNKPCFQGTCDNGKCRCFAGWGGEQCDHCHGRVV